MEVILVRPSKTLFERIESQFPRQETSQFAEELDVADLVAEVWPEPPDIKHLHIIVGLSGERRVYWVSEISLTVSRLSLISFLTSPRLSSLPC
jgi:hypothetical protein